MRTRGAPNYRSVAPNRRLECLNHFDHDTWRAAQARGSATRLPRKSAADRTASGRIRVGLIDSFRLRRDFLIEMLARTHPDLDVVPFVDVAACIEPPTVDLDVILYCGPDDGSSVPEYVNLLRKTFADVPLVILPFIGALAQRSELGRAFKTVALRSS
jgi:hypothetical protein